MIVPQNVINQIHKVEFSLFEPLSTTTLWAYPVGQSYDYRIFLSGKWESVADDADSNLAELIQRAELAIKAAVAATEGAEAVNATLIGNTLTVTDREGKTTSLDLSEVGGYEPPVGGIPKTDLAADVQASLGKADTALQSFAETDPTVPSWAKQSSKPIYTAQEVGALPADTPLFSGDYNDLDNKPNLATVATSGSYNDLSNKPTIPDAQIQSDWSQSNTSAKDFIKNKPDLTVYVQKSQTAGLLKNDGSVDTNTYLTQHQDISGKQDKIDATHKLSADLVEDGTTNKSYTATEKSKLGGIEAGAEVNVQANWNESNSSSDAYIQNKPTIPDAVSGTNDGTNWTSLTIGSTTKAIPSGGGSLPSNTAYLSNDSGDGIVPDDGIRAVTVTSAATMTISPDVVTVISGAVGTAAITLQVPNDNLAHVWDMLMNTGSSVAITFAMSNSETILYPDGFSVGASTAVEISVIGVGTKYYLRYGEFT